MAKSLKLLLIENVEALGIVGDVVNVRTGYARNFLLPRNLATTPSDELVKSLAAKRAEAEKQLAQLRKQREDMVGKLTGVEVTLVRACNDQGHLYGAISQQELAKALTEMGHAVKPREVRLHEVIKRLGNYDVHVKLDSDLDATIKLHVKPDREIDMEKANSAEASAVSAGSISQVRNESYIQEEVGKGQFTRKAKPGEAPAAKPDGEKSEKKDEAKGEKKGKDDAKGDKKTDKKSDKKPDTKPDAKADKAEKKGEKKSK